MTESKKKTTKKEVVETSEAPVKPAKKAKAKETKEKKETKIETSVPEEVDVVVAEETVKAEEIEKVEEVPAVETEVTEKSEEVVEEEVIKEKRPKTNQPAPEDVPVKEVTPNVAARSVVAAEDFDWDTFESEELRTSPKYKEYESMYDETLSTIAVDEVVIGTVIQMTSREVVINIGYKSEGVVSLNEFRYNPDLKVGDKVEVYVESQEDKNGQLLLSHKKARAINSWDSVNAALEKDEIIKGYIKCRTKGGMIVDVFGIEAFLPGSQIDVKPIRDYDILCW